MKIKTIFGFDQEKLLIKNYLPRIEWYEQNGYSVALPKDTKKADSKEKAIENLRKEYNQKDYLLAKEEILKEYSRIDNEFSEFLSKIFENNIPEIEMVLTKYGPGGSYRSPNKIIVKFSNCSTGDIILTILHETIHLYIQPYINKYKIPHWEKERIVDLVLDRFLKTGDWQEDYNSVEKYVDPLFNEFFFKSKDEFFAELNETPGRTIIQKS